MSKKLIYLISFVLVLGLAGNALAASYKDWDDGDPADHLWSSPANWGPDGLPTMIGDNGNRTRIESGSGRGNYPTLDATIFTVDPNGAFADRLYVGHKQGDGSTAKLWVTGGAKLTIRDDLNIGYDGNSHGICYVSGSDTVIDILDDIKVGRRGDGTLMMNGGTINVGGTIEVPSSTDTASLNIGHLQLNGGTITCAQLTMRPLNSGVIGTGTVDVRAGTLIINSDTVSTIQGFIDNGWITAYDGYGTLQLDYDVTNSGKTTLKALHILNPNPADGSTVSASLNQLQWTLPEPNVPGGVVTCDVYFGTDPNVEANSKVVIRQAVESVSVTLAPLTIYYWAFDLYDSSISTTEPVHLSPVFTFNTMNTAPVVDAGEDIDTWLNNGPRVVQLNGVVSDEGGGPGPATFLWTVVAEPDELHPAQISDPLAANPTVTVIEPGSYTLQLEAGDGEFTATDTMQIVLYADSCEHASNQEGFELIPGDINHDCIVDDLDLAILEQHWLETNYSTE
jgi:T5SS/PEP-CTERM-associated repeat protein